MDRHGHRRDQPRCLPDRGHRGVTDVVYYAAESDNVATLELHANLGFSPTGRWVNVAGAERPLTLHRLVM